MKVRQNIKPNQITSEQLSNFTDDWPIEELREAIKKGKKGKVANIKSADEHLEFFDSSS